jgi:2-succinyl-5-enolpyruvyl-6-hydroxy-3-cyclohexene-1-carboxylate synthase
MRDGTHPLVEQLIAVCVAAGVRDFVIAPGSRSAPLTVALSRRDDVTCRVVYDERSAGYIALGLAQQTRRAVGLVCTSGTAAVNFGPAVVEAFYQGVPLLVLTADRPPEWIDQQDNQAIHQHALYAPHVRASFSLPLDDGHPDTPWFVQRIASQAVTLAQGWEPGPVHINVPLREPLYPPPGHRAAPPLAAPAHQVTAAAPALHEEAWTPLLAQWQAAPRKLIVAGQHPPDAALAAALDALLAADGSAALFADIAANLHVLAQGSSQRDLALGGSDPATLDALRPDLIVNFGGQVTSKYLKKLLRGHTIPLWHVRPSLIAPDTYQALRTVIPSRPAAFFTQLVDRLGVGAGNENNSTPRRKGAMAQRPDHGAAFDYTNAWEQMETQGATGLAGLLATEPFGEFAAVAQVLAALPAGAHLQLGNSMAIRYANFAGLHPAHLPGRIDSNRGVSGIDGTVSTAVGAALANPQTLTLLLVGDLGFFYDRNGLWHAHLPPNLRIVLLNNHGGGIFDIIEGPDRLEDAVRRPFFLTPQPLTAARTAADFGLRYWQVDTAAGLAAALPGFFDPKTGPALLEVETDMAVNRQVFQSFRAMLGGLRLA